MVLVLMLTVHCLPLTAYGQGTPGTVRYPASVDTLDSLIRIKDTKAVTTLSGSITDSSTTISVPTGGTGKFDSTGAITVDDEIIYYTGKTSTTFTGLIRGACGSTALRHNAGSAVRSPLVACHHTTLAASLIATQTKLNNVIPPVTVDNAMARYDGTGGKLQNSSWILGDDGQLVYAPTISRGATYYYNMYLEPTFNLTGNAGNTGGIYMHPTVSGTFNSSGVYGGSFEATHASTGTAGSIVASSGSATNLSGSSSTQIIGGEFTAAARAGSNQYITGLYVGTYASGASTTVTTSYGVAVLAPSITTGATVTNHFAFYSYNPTGATNNYAFWSDSPGVYRIKGDGVMAYYNPAFSPKYTPGAVNFERVVQQWNSNVLEYGMEAGGTGTLRPLRLIGAGVQVNAPLSVYDGSQLQLVSYGNSDSCGSGFRCMKVPN
jgi:hypothetical protein